MSWLAIAASVIPAAITLGGGLYKLGSGLMAMATTVKELVAYHEDHEARIKNLEAAGAARTRRRPGPLVTVTIETR